MAGAHFPKGSCGLMHRGVRWCILAAGDCDGTSDEEADGRGTARVGDFP
jgi:hypothetical protein